MNCPECDSPLQTSVHKTHLVCTNCERQWYLSKPGGAPQPHDGRVTERLAKVEEAMVALDRRLAERIGDIKEDTEAIVDHLGTLNGTVADITTWKAQVTGAVRVLMFMSTSVMILALLELFLKKW